MNASDWAGWYGAVVGTAGLALSFWAMQLDRPRLVAKLKHGMKLSESVGDYSTEHTYTAITIANRGRRDAAIGKVWFLEAASAKQLLVIDALRAGTVDLAEGRSKDYLMRDDQLDLKALRQVMVEDGTGQVWSGIVEPNKTIKLKVTKA